MPVTNAFGPLESALAQPEIEMTLDEYEAIRLIDLLGCTQEGCAVQMGVARTTVQAVYDSARRKLAQALVYGKGLAIRGGDYVLCPHSGECGGKDCAEKGCASRRCECRGCHR